MVLYRAQLAPWSLEQCRELDVPVTKLLKKITKNMTSYPNRLLYVGWNKCGLGYKKLSDEIQIRKYNILHRGLAEGGDAGQACAGFLARASRFYGQTPLFGQEHWICSLLERMDECDLRINVGGSKPKGYYRDQILDEENEFSLMQKKDKYS